MTNSPPCECADAPSEGFNICRPCYALGELGLTRDGVATMRAAVERRSELEGELARVTAERDEARRELGRALMDMAAGFADITPGAD